MRIKARATLPLLLTATLAACAGGPPEGPTPRANLVGVWELVAVNDDPMPAPSPEEPSVRLESVVMTLEGDGAYSLGSAFRRSDLSTSQVVTIAGTWGADDTTLRFDSEQGPAIVLFGYTRDGDFITMVDEQGNSWRMQRSR